MEIIIQDNYGLYMEMLELEADKRKDFFKESMLKPFEELFKIMHMPMEPELMACLPLSGREEEMKQMLEALKNAKAWEGARETLALCANRFQAAGIEVPEKVVLGIFLGNPEQLAGMQGYTGVGSIPGYIQIIITPNDYNLPRLNSCIAHEFHHNVLFKNAKWNFMNVTLAKYLAVEGLAESFAASVFGEEFIGPWVTNVIGEDLQKSKMLISDKLNLQGFMEVRKYMFGDQLTNFAGAEPIGMPICGGYAVGYHAIQAFLKKTGISIEKATVIEGEVIMEQSGYFNE